MHAMRRKDREKDRTFGLCVLRKCEFATMATTNEDGTPYCIPLSVVLVGEDTIYFHCANDGHKMDNIRAQPKVCLSCVGDTQLRPEQFTTRYESAVVFGTVEIVQDDAERFLALEAFCAKYAPNAENVTREIYDRGFARVCICKIKIESISAKERE